MCGIHVDGENHFTIAPKPGGHFRFANAQYKSVYGTVKIGWEKTENGRKYTVEIPSNCTATIRIGGREETAAAGTYEYTDMGKGE